MSLDNNSIKIDDIQIESLDASNRSISNTKKKNDVNTTTQSENTDKNILFKKQESNEIVNGAIIPKIPWYKNYKNKRIMCIISLILLCTLVITILVILLLK